MKLTNPGEVSVYTVSGADTARPLPDWLARRRKRSLKQDDEYMNRVEVLQDFNFEEASTCVRVSEDGAYIMSTGVYKPQIHVHSTDQLSLSFARHTTSENVRFVLLSQDYSKSVHLQMDRKLEFHTPSGKHYETKIPRFGRDLVYVRESTEVLVPAVGLSSDGSGQGEVFRLNLERGQFMKSFQVDVGEDDPSSGLQGSIDVGAVNVAAVAENAHGLLAFGTSLGSIEFFDPRTKSRVATLRSQVGEITALDYSTNGLSLATGSSTGLVQIYDLRRPTPLLQRDQGYSFPIKNLIHLETATGERKILAADSKIIKIFDENNGDLWTSIEPLVDLNFVTHVKGSGMLLSANEGQQMHSWFIPQLGPAPRWCSFIDTMAHEMAEEVRTETYDNYKFLTIPELKSLNLSHLVGNSSLLRPYMHGYFVASKLYDQARLIANPYVWEEERTKRIKEKVDKERATRIRGTKKVKVNQKLADKLLKKQERRGVVDTEAGVLGDSRFGKLFEDEDFAVDETSWEFRALNPSTQVPGAENPAARGSSDVSDESNDESEQEDSTKIRRKPGDDVVMTVSSSQSRTRPAKDTALGTRHQKSGRAERAQSGDVVGERQITFIPESKKKGTPQPAAPMNRRADGRRSASTNTFRRL